MHADFPLELDHVTVYCSVDAPEARALETIGLQGFGGVTRHGDLGSASTAFFFSNLVYLELLWIHDEAAARQNYEPLSLNAIARMHWRESGASPVGLMLRQKPGLAAALPFAVRHLSLGQARVGFNGEVPAEPCYGVVPEALSFRGFRAGIADLPHPLGVKQLTRVSVTVQARPLSPIAHLLAQNGIASFEQGEAPLVRLQFDAGAQGRQADMRPVLPILLEY